MSDIKFESPGLEGASLEQAKFGRRRLVRAALAATPVVLALSGRSAMAASCQGLTLPTLMSVCPDGVWIGSSHHTLISGRLGMSPDFWKPRSEGQTFQSPYAWPVAPFVTIEMAVKKNGNTFENGKTVKWDASEYTQYRDIASDATGWSTGLKYSAVFAGSSEQRSFSRILLDDNSSLVWHVCVAYLNAAAMPRGTYVMTKEEVVSLVAKGFLGPGGIPLTDGQVKAFLSQTWA
jgi:hypothetical protein